MKLIKGIPSEPGYYWMRDKSGYEDGMIVEVTPRGELYVASQEEKFNPSEFGLVPDEFYGPIYPPEWAERKREPSYN